MVLAVVPFVQEKMKGNDGSHDFAHVQRVVKIADALASAEEMSEEQRLLVTLGALLHDVLDHKYVKQASEVLVVEQEVRELLQPFLPPTQIEMIMSIINNVSYSKEKKGLVKVCFPELSIVQDADKLDAMGSVGVARAFMFGGTRGSSLEMVVHHFYEKLLHLNDCLKTESARKIGEGRHQQMCQFLESLTKEFAMLA